MARSHIPKLFFVVVFFIETARFCFCKNTSFDCFEKERQALLNFKKSFIEHPSHILSSWEGTECCKWKGIRCSTTTGHVVKLDLRAGHVIKFDYQAITDQLVASEINHSVLELKYLNHLDLSGINFQGSTIPEFFGLMKQLEYLNLSYSDFTGMIPRQLGNLTNLRVLDLHTYYGRRGQLSIEDLSWVSLLKSLRYLDMSNTNLSGARNLMQVLNMLPSLLELRLSNCMLGNSQLPRPFVNSTFLSTIQHLDLSLNLFPQGPLPFFLENMTSLRVLDLSSNSFNSSIPLWLCNLKNLVDLSLAYNQFNIVEGGLSMLLWNHCHLKSLDLSYNILENESLDITQNSPGCTGYDLEEVRLREIGLTGHLPDWLGQFKLLKFLDLSYNSLNGPIPESLGQLLSLENLDLTSNSFEGALTEIHFSNLSKLVDFKISFNHLSFKVKPEWVQPPFQLNFINMNSCKFLSQFPQWLETQKKIKELHVSNASISGPLPNLLWFTHIRHLDLSHNHITGPLPRNIGDTMPTLEYLNVADNLINGTISSSLCKTHSLTYLDLSNNMLHGNIPNCWSDSNQLYLLKLSSNKLTGVIPNSIGRLSGLECLQLNNNSLHGEVPLSLRNCAILKILNPGENKFSGHIPTWIGEILSLLQILRLRKNMFDGHIPLQLCQLTSLQILDLAVNNLSGTIPHCFGNFSGMVLKQNPDILYKQQWDEESVEVVMKGRDYEYTKVLRLLVNMDLSDNNLIGMIPEGLTILYGLIGLNLSSNHFTGSIPKNIGNLISLESLDLCTNKLSGNIPTSMSDLTSLSHLNLSYNNFSGQIQTGHQLQTLVDPSIYAGNLELCGAPLQRCPGDELPQTPIPNMDEENDEEDKSEEVWFYTIPVLGYITGLWGVLGVLLFKKSWRYSYFKLADNVIDWIYVKVAIKSAWLKKKMTKNHSAN